MSTIWALIKALPEILAFLKMIDAKVKELKLEADVKKNVTQVHNAFASKDADELKKIFSN